MATRGGRFLGSLSFLFDDQTQADIYLSDAWLTVGSLKRISISTIHWGLSVAYIQSTTLPYPGRNHFRHNAAHLHNIRVVLGGEDPIARYHLPHLAANTNGPFVVNGRAIQAHPLLWHCHTSMRSLVNDRRLHYHRHAPRRDHTPIIPNILPAGPKRHVIGHELNIRTHLQNYRRMKEIPEWFEEQENEEEGNAEEETTDEELESEDFEF